MRLLLISDIHSNLPAAESALHLGRNLGADEIIHIGDAVAIGPWPSETLDCLISGGVRLLKGNHEEYVYMQPPAEAGIGEGEALHNTWLVGQLREDQKALCQSMPYAHAPTPGIRLQHFIRDGIISPRRIDLNQADLRSEFDIQAEELIVFGHIHRRFRRSCGQTEFISFGTSGCVMKNGRGKQCMLLEIGPAAYRIEEHTLDWDVSILHRELEARKVPAREEVIEIFYN